ncbi:hypothetical protein EOM86_13630 [Candidatus Nomurabacteria bacterium]|nr:hypothetical protein [Candidatus Nomurabacteria bacterium]
MTEQTVKSTKVYVTVFVEFDKTGNMKPIRLVWEDGEKFDIDRVLDVCPAAAMKAGGQGDRYTVRIRGKESFLFFKKLTLMNQEL